MPWLLSLLFVLWCPPAFAGMTVMETGLHVQVDGAVKRPGVYVVRRGGRVAEAIAAAGGPAPGAKLGSLNLARMVADGERCSVPTVEAPRPAPARKTKKKARRKAKAARPVGRVDVNRASAADLDTLPGVGPAMAKRILEVRAKLGGFKQLADLREVPGIGKKRLAKLAPLVEIR